MVYLDENKSKVLIFSGNTANKLLNMGHVIIQVRPDKRNKIKSCFVFKGDSTIESDIIKVSPPKDYFNESEEI